MEATAKDVMTRDLVSVTPATPVSEFARICTEDRISGAPVVTVDGRLVGIVSRTDLIPRLLEGRLPGRSGEEGGGPDPDDDDYGEMASGSDEEMLGTVDEIMEPDVVTVSPDTPVSTIARRMARERIHRVIVTEGDRIRGLITSLDLLKHFPTAAKKAKKAARKRNGGR